MSNLLTMTRRDRANLDAIVERAFYRECSGVQVPILEISAVFAAGRELLLNGATKAELEAGLLAHCQRQGYEGARA